MFQMGKKVLAARCRDSWRRRVTWNIMVCICILTYAETSCCSGIGPVSSVARVQVGG